MNTYSVITMIIVIGLVWGGFAFALVNAIKHEKSKGKNGKD